MRLIDADALEYYCNTEKCEILVGCNHCKHHVITEEEIDNAPTVEERLKGKWKTDKKSAWDLANCSACGELCIGYSKANFCPSCGAKME